MLREVQSPQRGVRQLYFHVDGSAVDGGSAVTTGLTIGANAGTITENSDGNYTITFARPGTRCLNVQVTPITDVSTCRVIEATATTVQIEQVGADQTTPLADADFYVLVVLQDASAET